MNLKLVPILVLSLPLASTEWGSQDGNMRRVPSLTLTTTCSVFSAVSSVTGGRMIPVCDRGVVEIDGFGTFVGAQIVDTAQEVVGVAMDGVRHAFRVHVGPQAGYLESAVPGFQEFQDAFGRVMDAGDQAAKFVQMVQILFRLPAAARRRLARVAPHLIEFRKNVVFDSLTDAGRHLRLPDKGRKHAEHVRRLEVGSIGLNHSTSPSRRGTVVPYAAP